MAALLSTKVRTRQEQLAIGVILGTSPFSIGQGIPGSPSTYFPELFLSAEGGVLHVKICSGVQCTTERTMCILPTPITEAVGTQF